MRNCPKCGSYLPENAILCPACGRVCFGATKNARDHVKAEKKRDKSWSASTITKTIQEDWTKFSQSYADKHNQFEQHQSHNPESENYYQSSFNTDLMEVSMVERLVSAAAYFHVLFVVPFIVCPQSEFAKFHGKQGVRLFVASLILSVIASVLEFSLLAIIPIILGAVLPIYTIIGVVNAITGRMKPLPIVGGSQSKD